MPRQTVDSLSHGDTVEETYLLADKQLRANRNGDLYLLTQLRDATGQVSGLMWNVSEQRAADLHAGGYAAVRGKAQLYNGQMQVIVNRIEPVDAVQVDPADFVVGSSEESGEHFERIQSVAAGFANEDLRTLLACYFEDEDLRDKLLAAPAGIKLHHAYPGGLVEHLRTIVELALKVGEVYPKVDTELLVTGAVLHDLSKVDELLYDATFGYSDEGQLIGHLVMGVELLARKIEEAERRLNRPVNPETVLRVKHMIVSHHGPPEHGSPKPPMTPEAVALWLVDNLDAKLNEFTTLIESDPNTDSAWTPFNNHLQRKLYKGGASAP